MIGMADIAIVDDSQDTLELLEFILKDHHKFLTYQDPEEFLKDFQPGRFALILIDISMPKLSGLEVFRRIRAVDNEVPICALTGVAHPKEREKALSAGFCDYFLKPILDIDRFKQVVYSHIGRCANPPHPSSDSPTAA